MSGYWYRENGGVLFQIRPTLSDLYSGLHWQHRDNFCFLKECAFCGRLTPEAYRGGSRYLKKDSTGRPLNEWFELKLGAYEYGICDHCVENVNKLVTIVYQCPLCKKYKKGRPVNRESIYSQWPKRHGGISCTVYRDVCSKCKVDIRKIDRAAQDCAFIEKLINRLKRIPCEKSKQLAS
jgi:hypothetical protein